MKTEPQSLNLNKPKILVYQKLRKSLKKCTTMNCGKNQAESGKNINVQALALLSKIRDRTPILPFKKFSCFAKGRNIGKII